MGKYNTRSKRLIKEYMKSNHGSHLTIRDVCDHFFDIGINVGQATVYRNMEELVEEGFVKKYLIDRNNAACFEYISDEADKENEEYHLVCEECGKLIHFHCEEILKFRAHLIADHDIDIDLARTVLYGVCRNCRAVAGENLKNDGC